MNLWIEGAEVLFRGEGLEVRVKFASQAEASAARNEAAEDLAGIDLAALRRLYRRHFLHLDRNAVHCLCDYSSDTDLKFLKPDDRYGFVTHRIFIAMICRELDRLGRRHCTVVLDPAGYFDWLAVNDRKNGPESRAQYALAKAAEEEAMMDTHTKDQGNRDVEPTESPTAESDAQ